MTAGQVTVVAGVMLSLAGCRVLATGGDMPARIVDSSDAGRAELQATINSVLHTEVTLADDALTASDMLVIEYGPPGSIDRAPVRGRVLAAPIRFQLVRNGAACFLVDQRDGARYRLAATRCTAR